MFKSYLLLVLMTVAGLSSSVSATEIDDVGGDRVSNAYADLIQAEHQLLKSELATEVKKSASFEKLLADGHASWLENRQQKLVVDILKAKLAAYEQFESQAKETLTGRRITFESKFGSMDKNSIQTRLAAIEELKQELTSLRQTEQKLANGIVTLPANDSWAESYRLRHALTGHKANVVAAKIVLLERLNTSQADTNKKSMLVSATEQAATVTTAWKRPSKHSSSMQLLITQAELQIKLSQHHLSNETRRLTSLQELAGRGMTTKRSTVESKSKVDAIKELLQEQQDNLSWLKKDLDAASSTDHVYTSVKAHPVSSETVIPNQSSPLQTSLPVLPSVLNEFELGQANYLRSEASLKGDYYREVLGKLELAVGTQPTNVDRSSADFSDVLVRGQLRELDQYRWKIKKTELQRDLADAQIALLKDSDGLQSDNLTMLVSTRLGSSIPVTLPSRFITSDPFGLQTSYSAFVYHSPRFKARRPALATRGDFSSVFRPVINRSALSYYGGSRSSRFGSSHGGFNRGSFHSGFRTFRPPGLSPFQFPGSPQTFNFNRFHGSSHFNSFGRSNRIYHSSGPGYHGR